MNMKTNSLNQHSPAILLALGIGGFISAVILAAKKAPEANERLAQLPPETPKIERVKAVAPVYGPVAGLILLSTGAILVSNNIMRTRYASLMMLYSFTDKMADRWKDTALKHMGEKKFGVVRDEVLTPDEEVPENNLLAEGPTILYDVYSGRWFNTRDVEHVRQAMNDVCETVFREDWAPLNDFYDGLGLPPIEYGNDVGWHVENGTPRIVLTPFIRDEAPYISISFSIKPRYTR